MNLKDLNEEQLKRFLDGVNNLADALQANRATNFSGNDATRQKDLDDAEKAAKDYARQRATGGVHPSRDNHLSVDERKIADETRSWIEKKRKQGWFGKK